MSAKNNPKPTAPVKPGRLPDNGIEAAANPCLIEPPAPEQDWSKAIRYFDTAFRERMLHDDPCQLFQIIQFLLGGIEAGLVQDIIELIYTKERAERMYQLRGEFVLKGTKKKHSAQEQLEIGQQSFLDYTKAEWSVMFATDKLLLYNIGFIEAKDGDLRKAVLCPSWQRALNLCKWKMMRANPNQLAPVVLHAIKSSDWRFLRKLSEAVAKPAQEIPQPKAPHDKLKDFFLRNWINEQPDMNGNPSPALAYFDDERLFDYLQAMLETAREKKVNSETLDALERINTSRSLRAFWERLGLIRASPFFHSTDSVKIDRNRLKRNPTGKIIVMP